MRSDANAASLRTHPKVPENCQVGATFEHSHAPGVEGNDGTAHSYVSVVSCKKPPVRDIETLGRAGRAFTFDSVVVLDPGNLDGHFRPRQTTEACFEHRDLEHGGPFEGDRYLAVLVQTSDRLLNDQDRSAIRL